MDNVCYRMQHDSIVMYQELLSRTGFSFERLASFCEMADAGSIAAVAGGDPNRASLISRQIRELEEFFGVGLVRRRGRGLELTRAGRDLAALGRENFRGLADFAASCDGRGITVRIVAANSPMQWLLLPRLGRVMESHPLVRFELHHEQTRMMVAATREGFYDAALVRGDALDPGFRRQRLGRVGYSLAIPRTLSPSRPWSAAKALVSLPLALPVGGSLRNQIESLAARSGKAIRLAVATTSYMQAAELVRTGTCAAVLPDISTANFPSGSLHTLPLSISYELCLAWTARNADTRPALASVLETLAKILQIED